MYTVVIPARPQDELISSALASIDAQTVPAASVLVVCNPGDTDAHAWASVLGCARTPTTVVAAPSDGLVSALNHGIANSRTPFLAFLDTDDVWLPEKQEQQMHRLRQEPTLDAVTCRGANFHISPSGDREIERAVAAATFTATTFRRATFDRFGLIDATATHFTWIYRWWAHARNLGIQTAAIDYVGLHRRIHSDNSWRVASDVAHRQLLRELRAQARRRGGEHEREPDDIGETTYPRR